MGVLIYLHVVSLKETRLFLVMIASIGHINHFRILISLVLRLLETELGRRQMRSRMLVATIECVHHC